MAVPISYELTTIRDIFEKVPTDRIQDCCRELGTMLAQSKALSDLLEAAGESLDHPAELVRLKMPDTVIWTDDGKGELTTTVHCAGEEVLRLETK